MKKVFKILLAIVIVGVLILLGVRLIQAKKKQEAQLPPAKEYTLRVHTIEPKVQSVRLSLPYIALVQNDRDLRLASRLSARIVRIASAGSKVRKGDLVVELDDKDLEAKLQALEVQKDSAKVELEAAKIALQNLFSIHKRTQELLKVQGASTEQFERELSQIASTKAKISAIGAKIAELVSAGKQLRQNLTYAKIHSPITGTVSAVMTHAGEMAMPGKPLLKIAADRGSYLQLSLPDELHATALIYRGKRFDLTPLHASRSGLRLWRTPELSVMRSAGERVEVELVIYEGNGILLPPDALLDLNGKKSVLFLEKGHALTHPIHVIASGTQGVVIQERDLLGRKVIVSKPDILLKLSAGVPAKAVR